MAYQPKVRISTYTEATQKDLASLCLLVYQKMMSDPHYQVTYQQLLEELNAALLSYQIAVAESVNGGKIQIVKKNYQKENLLFVVRNLANAVTLQAKGDVNYIINTGFDLPQVPVMSYESLSAPVIRRVEPTVNPGVVRLLVDRNLLTKGSDGFVVDYSIDGGITWVNKGYYSSTRITIQGLPACDKLQLRVCVIGSRDRRSPWSTTMHCWVR